MAKQGLSAFTEADVSLVAATAKTILAVASPAQFGCDLKKVRFSFRGTTFSDAPVLIELCRCTFATAGTKTSGTVRLAYGHQLTDIPAGFTCGYNYTAEPTVLDTIDLTTLSPVGGTMWYDFPLGDSLDCKASSGFALKMTAPANQTARASMLFERC